LLAEVVNNFLLLASKITVLEELRNLSQTSLKYVLTLSEFKIVLFFAVYIGFSKVHIAVFCYFI